MAIRKDDTERASISYSGRLHAEIDRQVDAGVANSRSEWFEMAGWLFIELQQVGADTLPEQYDADAAPRVNINVEGRQ